MIIEAIPFKGAHYMCVKDSPRSHVLKAANYAFSQGQPDIADALCLEALYLDGCAFEARESDDDGYSVVREPG
jgi:hypothetical protein